ncbi:MAG: porin family protein [Pseudomonadota bacterium]
MLQAMQAELSQVKSESAQGAQKDMEFEEWAASVKAQEEEHKHHMLFFRGGYARSDNTRNGVSIKSGVAPVGAQDQPDKDAWYIGAGFDFSLTDDFWGLMDNTDVLSELMFEYKQFDTDVKGNALANEPTQLAGGALNPRDITVNQFTLTAAPKIKFLDGHDFRPWVIPVGLAIHVVSPPSESITVLNPGIMFGAGADYKLWKDIYIGVDARYHLTGHDADEVNTDGLTAGGYLGIGF